MANFQKEGVKIIDELVHGWTCKYSHLTTFLEKTENKYKFLCEFSLPTPNKPVPVATVKIFFFLEPSSTSKNVAIKYRFENDSLIHSIDKTVHPAKMEEWIEKFLDKKKITSKILFLGTEFEATRIKDERIDRIIEQMNYRKPLIDNKRLSDSLLNVGDDIFNQKDDKENEREQMETMRKALFDVFRSFDKEDLGIVSFNEFEEVLKSLNLHLAPAEFRQLVTTCDLNKNGMIEYSEWIPIGSELIFGWWLKNRTEEYMRVKQEEFLFEAVMILHNDEIHMIAKSLIQECKKADEDELGTIKIIEMKKLLQKKSDILTESEIEGILKFIKKKYPQDFPYAETYNFILEFKINLIKNGLMESSLNEMDLYLRGLFKKYEKDKPNLIHISDMGEALRTCDKIVLSNVQIYMLQSFVEKDENSMVDYMVSSRFIGDMIKRFFSPVLLQKKAHLLSQNAVRFDELMDGWTEENIKIELNNIFHKFDENKDNLLDLNEYKKCVKASKIKITDEEIELMMQGASKSLPGKMKLEEFIAHFYSVLKFIRVGVALEKLAATP